MLSTINVRRGWNQQHVPPGSENAEFPLWCQALPGCRCCHCQRPAGWSILKVLVPRKETGKEEGGRTGKNQSPSRLETKAKVRRLEKISEPGGNRQTQRKQWHVFLWGPFNPREILVSSRFLYGLLCGSMEERAGEREQQPHLGSVLQTLRHPLSSSPKAPDNTGEEGHSGCHFAQKEG